MSRALHLKLYGTTEPPAKLEKFAIGPWQFTLDNDNIRYLIYKGIEVLRGVAFLVRDTRWGTCKAGLKKLKISKNRDQLHIAYDAICDGDERSFHYTASIKALSNGTLTFSALGSSPTDFPTNRTGFVVLHPLSGFVGKSLVVHHLAGGTTKLKVPRIISPDQPALDIAAISHSPGSGMKVHIAMTGDAYEMEDQRNWGDASFKTYVRPLAKPRPYVLPAHEILEQSVVVSVSGAPEKITKRLSSPVLEMSASKNVLPRFSLSLDVNDGDAVVEQAPILQRMKASSLIIRFDVRIHAAAAVSAAFAAVKALDTLAGLEIIIPGVDPLAELSSFAEIASAYRSLIATVVVVPSRDLKTRPSNHLPAGEASAAEVIAAARLLFGYAKIGSGTLALFTELNRNPPPADKIDFITHTICGIVHAADDVSVMETLQSFDDMALTVRKLAPSVPYHIGPFAIGMRENPYSSGPAQNPKSNRLTVALHDPRQNGLFAAAWTVGCFAAAARNGVASISLAHAVGDFGVVLPDGNLRPIYHVARAASLGTGKRAIKIRRLPAQTAAFGFRDGLSSVLIVANLSADDKIVRLLHQSDIAILDASSFKRASLLPDFLDHTQFVGRTVKLTAYATARISH